MKATKASVTPLRPHADTAEAAPLAEVAMSIAVIGVGYVGLVTAACLAGFGHRVTAVDIDASKLEALCAGQLPFHEAGLGELVAEQVRHGRLSFSADTAAALVEAGIVFIAVGTPSAEDGGMAMEAIDSVVSHIAAHVQSPAVVVVKSTVPVGTSARIELALSTSHALHGGEAPRVVSNPEFLREGSAIEDFMKPDRLLFGFDGDAGDAAVARLRRAYQPLIDAGVPVLTMDTRSAELSKCAANAMLAARLSFINEIASIAEVTGADIERVCDGIGSDHRIGRAFLGAGLGYGGSCFPKDVAALRHTARQHHLRTDVLTATERVNSRQRCWPVHAIARTLGGWTQIRGMRAAIWGLSFKPGTDDMRDAPSVMLIERLRRLGVSLSLYDPVAMNNARALLPSDRGMNWCASAADALEGADILLLVTEWPEFTAFPPEQAAAALQRQTVFDGRNALDAAAWTTAGMRVIQVGRPMADEVAVVEKQRVNAR